MCYLNISTIPGLCLEDAEVIKVCISAFRMSRSRWRLLYPTIEVTILSALSTFPYTTIQLYRETNKTVE